RTYQTALPAAGRGPTRRSPLRRFLAGGFVSGMLCKRILFCLRETQFAARRVDSDPVPLAEVPLEDPHGEGIEHATLDRPLERPGAIGGIVPLLDDQILGPI